MGHSFHFSQYFTEYHSLVCDKKVLVFAHYFLILKPPKNISRSCSCISDKVILNIILKDYFELNIEYFYLNMYKSR